MEEKLLHSFAPSFDENARILILGSMPGAASLKQKEYYAFPGNVFWPIMGELFGFSRELAYPERLQILCRNKIALWDTLQACERPGSLDTAITQAVPNDIPGLLKKMPKLEKICCNGGASYRYFKKFFPGVALPVVKMISTSPAAARYSFQEKFNCWQDVLRLEES